MGGRHWTPPEVEQLRRVWPRLELDEIARMFPHRRLSSIERKACALCIRRPVPATRRTKRVVHPICARLREERERQGLTRKQAAKLAGYHLNQLCAWENGKTRPSLQAITDWAGALGMALALRRAGDYEPMKAPTRAQLMGRK